MSTIERSPRGIPLRSDRLTDEELRKYQEDGFLVVEDFFADADLKPVLDEIESRVDTLAQKLYKGGKISSLHSDLDVWHRLTAMDKEFPGAAVLIHTEGVMGPALQKLFSHPRLLNLMSCVIGPDIAGHPVWNVRSKTPGNVLANVPWHQDTAYLAAGSEHTVQPTAWIPLLNTTPENGTLQLIRGGHKSGVVFPHHLERGRKHVTSHAQDKGDPRSWYLYIRDEDLPAGDRVQPNVHYGSFILFGNLIPHCAGANSSDTIRWTVDLRWQHPDAVSGFEAVKDVIVMRSSSTPDLKLDFEKFNARNRHVQTWHAEPQTADDEFNTDVKGPWLERWAETTAH